MSSKAHQMAIRLTGEQRDQLQRIADESGGLDVSQIIRFAIDALIAHYDRCGGRLILPINFDEVVVTEVRRRADETAAPKKKTA